MQRGLICGLISLSTIFGLSSASIAAPGALVRSWNTDGGWLTELRVHPNGAKVCSTGKASNAPHTFGLTLIRSGPQYMVLLADEAEPPAGTSGGDMTFIQAGRTVGVVKVQVEGPAWASADPASPEASALTTKLSPGPATIRVAGRQYQIDLTGLPDALAQLNVCETQAAQ